MIDIYCCKFNSYLQFYKESYMFEAIKCILLKSPIRCVFGVNYRQLNCSNINLIVMTIWKITCSGLHSHVNVVLTSSEER